jgi:hypothetical protein
MSYQSSHQQGDMQQEGDTSRNRQQGRSNPQEQGVLQSNPAEDMILEQGVQKRGDKSTYPTSRKLK